MNLSSPSQIKQVLIVDPNLRRYYPYGHFPSSYRIITVPSIKHGFLTLHQLPNQIDLVIISSSFSLVTILEFLEDVKSFSQKFLIPVLLLVDLHQRLITFPGTTWGNKFGIIHSLTSKEELLATLNRVLDGEQVTPPYLGVAERPEEKPEEAK